MAQGDYTDASEAVRCIHGDTESFPDKPGLNMQVTWKRSAVVLSGKILSLHEFAREHYSEQNSSALVTVWRVVIEKCVTLV